MRNDLISDINAYISYLNSRGLSISVHGRTVCGLLEHNIHTNPFCTFVKTNNDVWEKCIKCQQKLFNLTDRDLLFGMCHAGVEEYVFFVDSKTFISVGGYGIHPEKARERISCLSRTYFLDKEELENIYRTGLKHTPEDLEQLKILIHPLCHMISLLQLTIGEVLSQETQSKTFDSILAYVQRNITQDISLRSIAQACSCSESTVSHLFKCYTNKSVKQYIIDYRLQKAKNFLQKSDLSVSDIALLTGFTNANYFSIAFRKYCGLSPTEYKRKIILNKRNAEESGRKNAKAGD